jgi:hypothetical protein
MAKIFVFLSKVFFSILFTLVLLEIGLRIFPDVIPLDLLIHFDKKPRAEIARNRGLPTRWDVVLVERDDGGPDFGVFKPFTKVAWPIRDNGMVSTVVMDDIGFCNPPENSYHLPRIDIIMLGDSFTVCHAVRPQETWTSKLSASTGVSAYNLGKGGIGIHEYLQIFKKFGIQKSPQIVIMNIYEGNDFRDARKFYRHRLRQEEGDIQPTPAPSSALVERHSYAFNLAYAVDKHVQQTDFFTVAAANTVSETEHEEINFRYRLEFPDMVFPWNLENTDTDEVRYAKRLNTLEVETGIFAVVEEALRSFVELSQQHGFVPIVTYTPSAHTAYADYVIFDDPTLNDLMPWFSHLQREFLKQKGTKLGYVFIDLTPHLQAAAQTYGSQNLLYYRYDLHLTPTGHHVVAEAISKALRELNIVASENGHRIPK